MAKIINVVYKVNDKELAAVKKEIQGIEKETKDAEKGLSKMGQTGSKAAGFIAGAIGTIGLAALGKQIFDITAEFQKLNAVLTNTLGSQSEARKALRDIQDFASKTPFSVVQLTQSFVKLANQGFKPTVEELRKLGDIASSQGKEFDQLTEAIIDAQTGEFERLKEFGIRASKEGDKVTFTFKGVETQTKFTSEAIREYILSLGDAAGVSGAMAAISDTLSGKVSNLGDNFDALFNSIGQEGSGILAILLDSLNEAIGALNQFIKDANRDVLGEFAERQVEKFAEPLEQAFTKWLQSGKTNSEDLNAELALIIDNINQIVEENDVYRQQLGDPNLSGESFKDLNNEYEANRRVLSGLIELKDKYLQKITDENNRVEKTVALTKEQIAAMKALQKAMDDAAKLTENDNAILPEVVLGTPDQFESYFGNIRSLLEESSSELTGIVEDQYDRELDALKEKGERELDELQKQNQRKQELQQAFTDFAIDSAQQILNAFLTTNQLSFDDEAAKYDERIRLAGDNERARQEIELEREQAENRFRQRQKEQEKQAALRKIAIDTAVNIIRSIANNGGIPLGLPFGALAAAAGLVQAATVRKFKKGEINIDGPGTRTSDSIPAMISRGESVISADATAKSTRLLEAINNRELDDTVLYKLSAGGTQATTFDDSGIIAAIERNRVDYARSGYSLMQTVQVNKDFKRIIRSKIIN